MEVAPFVIGCAVLPAASEEADPLVGERADDGEEALTFFLPLTHERFGPGGVFPRFLGPLDEALPRMIVAPQPAVNLAHFAV